MLITYKASIYDKTCLLVILSILIYYFALFFTERPEFKKYACPETMLCIQ